MVPGTAYKNYCHCRSWKEIGDFKFFTTVCGLSRSSLLSVIHKGWSDLGKSLHPQWCVMMSGGHHVARSRYMLEWQDHGLEAHEFQAEFVPVSQICEPEADTGALVLMWELLAGVTLAIDTNGSTGCSSSSRAQRWGRNRITHSSCWLWLLSQG